MPNSTLTSKLNGARGLDLNTLLEITTRFEDLSTEWLLRGKGEMLLDNNNLLSNAPEEPVDIRQQMRHDYNNALIDNLKDTYDKILLESSKQQDRQQKQIDSLQAQIGRLLEIIGKQMNG
ncbi:hypothetical protein NXX89_04075 [Bacteroides thetaiotaomicron]|nr:hypothetical protein [Bacteroides thetaiotaomicron]MCS3210741.1 hypothetical protein [Bacteroides thetaiotaomicron]